MSDNASSDETKEFMAELLLRHSNIKYYRNQENIGADANILNCVNKAEGQYVFLLADDDIALPGAVDKIRQIISGHDVGLIYLNACGIAAGGEIEREKSVLPLNRDVVCRDGNEFLAIVRVWVTFLSSLVVKKSLYPADAEKFFHTHFLQSYGILTAVRSTSSYITGDPYVAYQAGNTGGYNFYRTWGYNFNKLMDYCAGIGYDKKIVRKVKAENMKKYILPWTMRLKTQKGLESSKGWFWILRSYKLHPFAIFVLLPLYFAPAALIRVVRRVLEWIVGRRLNID